MLNVLEITLMKLLKFIACKRFQKQLIARFAISFYMKYFRDNSAENFVKLSLCEQFQKYFCCNISYNILQNFFRIISHKIWKVEIILKPSWKFSATIGAVWVDSGNDEDNDIEITENGVVNEKKRMIDQDKKDNKEKRYEDDYNISTDEFKVD